MQKNPLSLIRNAPQWCEGHPVSDGECCKRIPLSPGRVRESLINTTLAIGYNSQFLTDSIIIKHMLCSYDWWAGMFRLAELTQTITIIHISPSPRGCAVSTNPRTHGQYGALSHRTKQARVTSHDIVINMSTPVAHMSWCTTWRTITLQPDAGRPLHQPRQHLWVISTLPWLWSQVPWRIKSACFPSNIIQCFQSTVFHVF